MHACYIHTRCIYKFNTSIQTKMERKREHTHTHMLVFLLFYMQQVQFYMQCLLKLINSLSNIYFLVW